MDTNSPQMNFRRRGVEESQPGRPAYLSVTLDDPSFPATIYVRLIEDEDGSHSLIWSRGKPAN